MIGGEKLVINLITKNHQEDLPDWFHLVHSITRLRDFIFEYDLPGVIMPHHIGCGYDQLPWSRVWTLLVITFELCPIHIQIYRKPGMGCPCHNENGKWPWRTLSTLASQRPYAGDFRGHHQAPWGAPGPAGTSQAGAATLSEAETEIVAPACPKTMAQAEHPSDSEPEEEPVEPAEVEAEVTEADVGEDEVGSEAPEEVDEWDEDDQEEEGQDTVAQSGQPA